jgi:hypothetical protein
MKIENFLMNCDGQSLREEFHSAWINELIPGLDQLENCDQGSLIHLEGNVAIHTALVFDNLLMEAQLRL